MTERPRGGAGMILEDPTGPPAAETEGHRRTDGPVPPGTRWIRTSTRLPRVPSRVLADGTWVMGPRLIPVGGRPLHVTPGHLPRHGSLLHVGSRWEDPQRRDLYLLVRGHGLGGVPRSLVLGGRPEPSERPHGRHQPQERGRGGTRGAGAGRGVRRRLGHGGRCRRRGSDGRGWCAPWRRPASLFPRCLFPPLEHGGLGQGVEHVDDELIRVLHELQPVFVEPGISLVPDLQEHGDLARVSARREPEVQDQRVMTLAEVQTPEVHGLAPLGRLHVPPIRPLHAHVHGPDHRVLDVQVQRDPGVEEPVPVGEPLHLRPRRDPREMVPNRHHPHQPTAQGQRDQPARPDPGHEDEGAGAWFQLEGIVRSPPPAGPLVQHVEAGLPAVHVDPEGPAELGTHLQQDPVDPPVQDLHLRGGVPERQGAGRRFGHGTPSRVLDHGVVIVTDGDRHREPTRPPHPHVQRYLKDVTTGPALPDLVQHTTLPVGNPHVHVADGRAGGPHGDLQVQPQEPLVHAVDRPHHLGRNLDPAR